MRIFVVLRVSSTRCSSAVHSLTSLKRSLILITCDVVAAILRSIADV